jgi:hypothetical protein
VQFFLGSQMLTNGTYHFLSLPTLSIFSGFTNGAVYYTTNGSAPSLASTPYTSPFLVTTSATIRAIGYSEDFAQSDQADPVNIIVPPVYSLTATSTVGGSVTIAPEGGIYYSNTVVTVTATPTNGWTFLYWLGDATGSSNSANVIMGGNRNVHAVFGTTLSTSVTGNGEIILSPPTGPYPYGTVVRLTGVPQLGSYFENWGNAASGDTNPLYFTISNPAPTVSGSFVELPDGQAGLTVAITGRGHVNVDPGSNVYATNSSVTLTAMPDAGETFRYWSGDASGTQNPLTLEMTHSRLVVANFTGPFKLNAIGLSPAGFRMTVGESFGNYQVYGSTNFVNWTGLGSVSNGVPLTLFTDLSVNATNTIPRGKYYRASP